MDVTERIRKFINEEVLMGADDVVVDDDTPLLGDTLDSMALMRLVAFLEEEFDIEIDEMDVTADNFRTVEDMARLVRQNAAQAS